MLGELVHPTATQHMHDRRLHKASAWLAIILPIYRQLSLIRQLTRQDLMRVLNEEAVSETKGKPTLHHQCGRGYPSLRTRNKTVRGKGRSLDQPICATEPRKLTAFLLAFVGESAQQIQSWRIAYTLPSKSAVRLSTECRYTPLGISRLCNRDDHTQAT
jgi:hypothetical protein